MLSIFVNPTMLNGIILNKKQPKHTNKQYFLDSRTAIDWDSSSAGEFMTF